MTRFKTGDIAILQNMPEKHARLNGEEAMLKRRLHVGDRVSLRDFPAYPRDDGFVADIRGYGLCFVRDDQLRARPDPKVAESVTTDLMLRLRYPQKAV